MIRLGFVGAGQWMRTYHLPTAQRLAGEGKLSLAAIWNRTTEKAEALAEEFGIARVHDEFDSLLSDSDVDAFVVALTKESVGTVLRKLASRGLPILVEKPPASGAAEARELSALLQAPTMVAFNRNYTPLHERLGELLRDTEPYFAECHFLRRRRNDPKYVTETGIHALAFLDSLLGAASLSSARREELSVAAGNVANWHARLEHRGGCRSELHFLPFAGHAVERYQFHGKDRSIYVAMKQHYARDEESAIEIWSVGPNDDTRVEHVEFSREDLLLHDGYLGEYRRFLDALEKGSDVPTTLQRAVPIMELAERIEAG